MPQAGVLFYQLLIRGQLAPVEGVGAPVLRVCGWGAVLMPSGDSWRGMGGERAISQYKLLRASKLDEPGADRQTLCFNFRPLSLAASSRQSSKWRRPPAGTAQCPHAGFSRQERQLVTRRQGA